MYSLLIICYKSEALIIVLFIWLVLITTKIKTCFCYFRFEIPDIDGDDGRTAAILVVWWTFVCVCYLLYKNAIDPLLILFRLLVLNFIKHKCQVQPIWWADIDIVFHHCAKSSHHFLFYDLRHKHFARFLFFCFTALRLFITACDGFSSKATVRVILVCGTFSNIIQSCEWRWFHLFCVLMHIKVLKISQLPIR